MRLTRALVVLGTLVAPAAASAYTGPGLGLGAITTALGVVGAVFLGLFAVIWYPVKRLARRLRGKPARPRVPTSNAEEPDRP